MKPAIPFRIFALSIVLLIGQVTTAYSQQQSLNSSPSDDKNYILTNTYSAPFSTKPGNPTTSDVIQQITYFDGLGRPLQEVHVKGNPDFDDIVTPHAVDDFGRETQVCLPYATGTGNAGALKTEAVTSQAAFYNSAPAGVVTIPSVSGTTPSYAQTIFERSPFNRPLEQGAPGAAWQVDSATVPGSGHTVKSAYHLNNDIAITNLEETRQ